MAWHRLSPARVATRTKLIHITFICIKMSYAKSCTCLQQLMAIPNGINEVSIQRRSMGEKDEHRTCRQLDRHQRRVQRVLMSLILHTATVWTSPVMEGYAT
ncbi:hypothetical protein EDD85DRAFT_865064 [Armillaria nabsnona]|nr:hypothetical protein EDD85DRAFT_865064 [Armillaria nabsnona]